MRPAFLSAPHGPRSKVNLQLGWGERDELDMLDLIALAITKRNKYHLLIFGDLCSAITGLPKSLGALDNRRQRTAFESDCVEKLNDGRGRVRRDRAAERVIGTPLLRSRGSSAVRG